jgi:peptidoglycan/xylan/chitin deacetylase (PgdA/CDA1 family)
MHRLGFSAVFVFTGVVLVLGSGVDGQVRPAESMRERQAVARIAARGLPLYCGGGRTREVALSFDDGPTTYTPRLLKALREASRFSHAPVPATFFLIGQSAARYRSYARAEAEVGSVGAHTQTHTTLTGLAPAAARREIVEGKRSVERALGEIVHLFRPTEGRRNPPIDRIVASSGLLTVMWTVDPRDWAMTDPVSVTKAVASDPRLVPGAIVVLHEFNLTRIEAVPAIVRDLRHRGLLPVTVPRLLLDDPPTLAEQREDARGGA